MRRIVQGWVVAVAALLTAVTVAGCGSGGSSKRSAATVADCLNAAGFLVEASGAEIDGTAPSGVSLTLAPAGTGTWTLATSYGPTPSKLAGSEHATVVSCLKNRGPAPGTLTTPAAR